MAKSIRTLLLILCLAGVGYFLLNVPSCAGGGVKLVNGEWVNFETLSLVSKDWPRADAVIVDSQLKQRRGTRSTNRRNDSIFQIRYEFTVNDKRYEGDTVQFVVATEKQKKSWAKLYTEGKRIKVSYDPTDPGLSVIVSGT